MYDIFLNDSSVGSAEVKKEGLYYRFFCTCIPPDSEIYRIAVSDGENRQDLGICVPEKGKFILNTRIPCKYLSGDTLTFILVKNNDMSTGLPVADGEPFEHLDKLETAHLCVTDGQPEIVIDPIPNPRDSDQNQESQNESEQQ